MEITGAVRGMSSSVEMARDTAQASQNQELMRAVRALNTAQTFGHDRQLTFHRDRETHRMVIRVVNVETDEVLMQIPREYILRVAEELKKLSR